MATDDPPREQNPLPEPSALADPAIRRALEEFVRRRVPGPDVDDVVQTVLCDALAAPGRPADAAELRRWLLGIARHKVADLHRRSARESASELPELSVAPPPIEARELARWAEEQAASTRDAKQTLTWMAREGEGEKLESIAEEERVPAARVRQRVSRMRRWMKERWQAELAAVAALALLGLLIAWALRRPKDEPEIAPRPEPAPAPRILDEPSADERARALRAEAARACSESAWQRCLDQLDEAARLDPEGDVAPEVAGTRERARRALEVRQGPTDGTKKLAPVPTPKAPAPLTKPTAAPNIAPAPIERAPAQKVAPKSKPPASDVGPTPPFNPDSMKK